MTLEFADPDEVLATVKASSGRRLIGLTSLSALGVFLAYIAFTSSPGLGWQIFLLACGGAAIWMADRMRRATASVIELTPTELRDGDGTVIARVAYLRSNLLTVSCYVQKPVSIRETCGAPGCGGGSDGGSALVA